MEQQFENKTMIYYVDVNCLCSKAYLYVIDKTKFKMVHFNKFWGQKDDRACI